MAGSMNDYMENKVLEYILRANFTMPGTVYVGLWKAALADDSTGSTGNEVSGGGYARVAIVRGTAAFGAASGGSTNNSSILDFGTASADWGTVSDFGICDATSGGNMMFQGTLTASKVIQNGDPVTIPAASLAFSLT